MSILGAFRNFEQLPYVFMFYPEEAGHKVYSQKCNAGLPAVQL